MTHFSIVSASGAQQLVARIASVYERSCHGRDSVFIGLTQNVLFRHLCPPFEQCLNLFLRLSRDLDESLSIVPQRESLSTRGISREKSLNRAIQGGRSEGVAVIEKTTPFPKRQGVPPIVDAFAANSVL